MKIIYGFPKLLQKLHRLATANDFNLTSARVFSSWRSNSRYYSWKSKFVERLTADHKLLFALAAGFSFKDHGVPDEKFKSEEDIEKEFDKKDDVQYGWEILVDEPDFRACRRKLKGSGELYEYKCAGSYYDITPRNFLDAQNDLSYRKEWDNNIISLELLAENEDQELLRWISKFPYPMNAREYIYARRTWVSKEADIVVVESDVVPENVIPSLADKSNIRVETYTSRMAIRAHGDWNEHGLDYILTYSDNPEANIPRYIYNWLINQGGPYFLKQVHAAALHLELSGKEISSVMDKYRKTIFELQVEEEAHKTAEDSSDKKDEEKAEELSKFSQETIQKERPEEIFAKESHQNTKTCVNA